MSDQQAPQWSVLWRVDRDGRRMQCDVRATVDFLDAPSYEISVSHNGVVLYTRMLPTREPADRTANEALRDLLSNGWMKAEL